MRYKNVIQYYVVIGVYTIYLKDRREDPFLIQYIIVNFDMSDTSVNHRFYHQLFQKYVIYIYNG